MMADVRCAWKRRELYLEEERKQRSDEERASDEKKRKRMEIKELEDNKLKIMNEKDMSLRTIDQRLKDLRN